MAFKVTLSVSNDTSTTPVVVAEFTELHKARRFMSAAISLLEFLTILAQSW